MSSVSLPGAECGDCDDCLQCHSHTIERWIGTRQFDALQDISLLSRYHHKLLQWQTGSTALIWRLRFDVEQKAFLDVMRRARNYNAGVGITPYNTLLKTSSEQINEAPTWWPDTWLSPPSINGYGRRYTARIIALTDYGFVPAAHNDLQIGPVRDGRMRAVFQSGRYWHSLLATDYTSNWTAPADFGLGFTFGFCGNWTALGDGLIRSTLFPEDADINVPLAVDIGCVRYENGQQEIRWPALRESVVVYDRWDTPTGYTQFPSIEQLAVAYDNWWSPSAPEEFIVTVDGNDITVPGVRHEHIITPQPCEPLDEPTIHALTWLGDQYEPLVTSNTPPVVVCWTEPGPAWTPLTFVPPAVSSVVVPIWRAWENQLAVFHRDSVPHVGWCKGWANDGIEAPKHVSLDGVRGIILTGYADGWSLTTPSDFGPLQTWLTSGSAKVLAVVNPAFSAASDLLLGPLGVPTGPWTQDETTVLPNGSIVLRLVDGPGQYETFWNALETVL